MNKLISQKQNTQATTVDSERYDYGQPFQMLKKKLIGLFNLNDVADDAQADLTKNVGYILLYQAESGKKN